MTKDIIKADLSEIEKRVIVQMTYGYHNETLEREYISPTGRKHYEPEWRWK